MRLLLLFMLLIGVGIGFALGYWWREQKENDARPAGDIQRRYQNTGNSVGEPWA